MPAAAIHAPAPANARRRWALLGGALLVIAAVLYAYQNSTAGPFVFDDQLSIARNPAIRQLWPPSIAMFPAARTPAAGRPLVAYSFAVNYAIGGLDPFGYHVGNILLHAAAAVLLMLTIELLLCRRRHPVAVPIAVAAALVWAVHPLLTDAVTYITNRIEVMMSLFLIGTVYSFLRSLDTRWPKSWQSITTVSSIAAACCKEVAAMIPLLLLLADVLLITSSWRETIRRRWPFHLQLAITTWAMSGVCLLGTSIAVRASTTGRISSWQYLLMQSQIITRYLRLSVWPRPLVICYIDWPVPAGLHDVWPWMLFIGGLFIATAVLVIRKNAIGFFGVWCFLILAPTSSLLPLSSEPAAERRMYLPLAALVLGGVLLVERLTRAWRNHARLARFVVYGHVAAVAILVLILAQATLLRNDDYASDLQIWADAMIKRPNNPRAQNNVGGALVAQNDDADALPHFDRAIELAPAMHEAYANRGIALIHLGRGIEGVAALQRAVGMDPSDASGWATLGWGLQRVNQPADARLALQHALQLDPNSALAKDLLDHPRPPATQGAGK